MKGRESRLGFGPWKFLGFGLNGTMTILGLKFGIEALITKKVNPLLFFVCCALYFTNMASDTCYSQNLECYFQKSSKHKLN